MKHTKFKNTNPERNQEHTPEMLKEIKNYKTKKIGGK